MELGLELVTVISSNFFDAKRELFVDIIGEGDGIGLIMALIDFECPDARCIINSCVLITFDRFVVFALESQKLHINLNLMARNLLLVPNGVDFTRPGAM